MILQLLMLCNSTIRCVVKVKGEILDPFETCKGLRHSDELLPVFLNLALKCMLRKIFQLYRMEVNIIYTLLAYADDAIIMDDLKQDVTSSMSSLMKMGRSVGLSVYKKIKYMYMTGNV